MKHNKIRNMIFICLLSLMQQVTAAEMDDIKQYAKREADSAAPKLLPFNDLAAVDCGQKNDGGAQGGCGAAGAKGASAKLVGGNPKQKAANIAMKAAQEAKEANDAQASAGEAAALAVRLQLAEKAMQAARAAEAALAGKQQIVEQLENEVREAEEVVQEEETSLQNTQANVEAAVQAAQDAAAQLATLKHAIATGQSNVANAETAAGGAQQAMQEKTQLLDAARTRVENLLRQLTNARQDFDKTKAAAYKAVCAAAEAKSKAARVRRSMNKRQMQYEVLNNIRSDLLQRLWQEKFSLQRRRAEPQMRQMQLMQYRNQEQWAY